LLTGKDDRNPHNAAVDATKKMVYQLLFTKVVIFAGLSISNRFI
jgi:hypothetical protein